MRAPMKSCAPSVASAATKPASAASRSACPVLMSRSHATSVDVKRRCWRNETPSSIGTPSCIGSARNARSFGSTLPTSIVTSNRSSFPARSTAVATMNGKNDGTVAMPPAATVLRNDPRNADIMMAATAPASAPDAFANTSDTELVLSTVSNCSVSTDVVSTSPRIATTRTRAAAGRGRCSAHIPKIPNGTNSRTLPTKSGIDTRPPVSAAIRGFQRSRARCSSTSRRS